jgi:hypothetical protein
MDHDGDGGIMTAAKRKLDGALQSIEIFLMLRLSVCKEIAACMTPGSGSMSIMDIIEMLRQQCRVSDEQVKQSESWMDCLECTCDMGVSSSLLTDSQDDGASPWRVVAIVLQVVGVMDRLMMYLAEGGSKRHPLGRSAADEVLVLAPEFSRPSVLVQHGIGIDRQTIVPRLIGEESHPRLGLALILPEA